LILGRKSRWRDLLPAAFFLSEKEFNSNLLPDSLRAWFASREFLLTWRRPCPYALGSMEAFAKGLHDALRKYPFHIASDESLGDQ
jgi:hypothetical protein